MIVVNGNIPRSLNHLFGRLRLASPYNRGYSYTPLLHLFADDDVFWRFFSWHVVRGNRPGKPVQLAEYEIKYLCTKAREIFISQPILLELEAPIKICGQSAHLCCHRFFL